MIYQCFSTACADVRTRDMGTDVMCFFDDIFARVLVVQSGVSDKLEKLIVLTTTITVITLIIPMIIIIIMQKGK